MKYLLFIILPIFFISCQKKNNLESVIKQYNMKVNSYDKIEYDVTRIDTFSRDFSMDRNGTILIEKNIRDTLFNMSFYGQSSSVPTKRSEEHTSELQSRENLVCRLLLEKKK